MTKILVYGTLKMGKWNHRLIEESEYLGDVVVHGYKLVYSSGKGSFPFAVPDNFSKMRGELFEVTDEQLARMDRLEGHPDWYLRTDIQTEDGQDAQMYVMNRPPREQPLPCEINAKHQYEWN